MTIDKEFYTVEELSKLLKVNYRTILREIERENLTATKVGRIYIVSKDSLHEYVDQKNIKRTINVAVAVIIRDGKCVIVERRKQEGKLHWQCPSGTVLKNEHSARRAEREAYVETGIRCKAVKLLGERLHPDTKVVISYWVCEYISGELINGDSKENVQAIWVNKKDVPSYFTSNIFPPLKRFLLK